MFLQIVKLCMFLQVLLIKIQTNMILKHQRTLKKPIKKIQERLKTLKGLETCEDFLVFSLYRCWRLESCRSPWFFDENFYGHFFS